MIDEERLAATTAPRMWAVNMQGGGWGTHVVRVPRSWKAVATHRFPEVYRMQGEIVVVEYLTRPSPATE